MDKANPPDEDMLRNAIGDTYHYWELLREYVHSKYPAAKDDWNFPGANYGWNFRIRDKKRAIIYLLPRENYFKVAFVFGQKATECILNSTVSEEIKTELASARVYAEGRGIRLDINNEESIRDIKFLIDTKLSC